MRTAAAWAAWICNPRFPSAFEWGKLRRICPGQLFSCLIFGNVAMPTDGCEGTKAGVDRQPTQFARKIKEVAANLGTM
jgi:hypothetical protein